MSSLPKADPPRAFTPLPPTPRQDIVVVKEVTAVSAHLVNRLDQQQDSVR